VKRAIEQNIDLEEPRGSACLRLAARHGSINIFQELVNVGADIGKKDEEERTLLHCACRNGSIDIVRELIKYKVNLDEVDRNGWSAIYYAIYFEHLEIVKELLNSGVDVNLKSANEANPLYLACKRGYLEICRELIKANADVNQLGTDGRSPIHVAYINHHFDVVRELIKAKADVHKNTSASGNTLLHDVCRMGLYQLFRDLVDSGIDVTTKNSDGITAFQLACLSNHTNIITEYLDLDIDPNQFNQMVEDGFYFISSYRLYDAAKLLIPRMRLCVLKTKYKQINRKKNIQMIYHEIQQRNKLLLKLLGSLYMGHRDSISILSLLPHDMIREISKNVQSIV
jgi:ankyrin repeat protein